MFYFGLRFCLFLRFIRLLTKYIPETTNSYKKESKTKKPFCFAL
jgi:hypothetical protein